MNLVSSFINKSTNYQLRAETFDLIRYNFRQVHKYERNSFNWLSSESILSQTDCHDAVSLDMNWICTFVEYSISSSFIMCVKVNVYSMTELKPVCKNTIRQDSRINRSDAIWVILVSRFYHSKPHICKERKKCVLPRLWSRNNSFYCIFASFRHCKLLNGDFLIFPWIPTHKPWAALRVDFVVGKTRAMPQVVLYFCISNESLRVVHSYI